MVPAIGVAILVLVLKSIFKEEIPKMVCDQLRDKGSVVTEIIQCPNCGKWCLLEKRVVDENGEVEMRFNCDNCDNFDNIRFRSPIGEA